MSTTRTDTTPAIEVVELLGRAVENTGIPLEHGLPLIVLVSIGAASLSSRNTSIDTMLGNADKALYAAKNEGRNCVRAFAADRATGDRRLKGFFCGKGE